MAREGQRYPCYQRDMMMMIIAEYSVRNNISLLYLFKQKYREIFKIKIFYVRIYISMIISNVNIIKNYSEHTRKNPLKKFAIAYSFLETSKSPQL